MFLCDRCHDVDRHVDRFRSLGRCETCKRVAPCIDCHVQPCPAPKAAPKEEEKVVDSP